MSELDRDTMYALLREIREVAMHASMTGGLRKSTRVLCEVYNRCRSALINQGDALVGGIFPELSAEGTSVDDVGAAAALLSSYIRPKKAGPGDHLIRRKVKFLHEDPDEEND